VTTVDEKKDEFGSLLAAFAESEDETVRQQTEARIWQRYGTRGVVFISDMCGFSRTTRTYGICHFLCHIERARRIIAPEVLRHGGRLLKFEIDNSFAFFNDIDSALLCARDLTLRVEEFNARGQPGDQIALAIGIDEGDLLLIDDHDFFGDPVNTACKLGEDVAAEGEVLVTARALALATQDLAYVMDRRLARISGIDIEYARLAFMHARGRR
jgi:adenylate cyclase